MAYNQQVPSEQDDGCGWLLSGNVQDNNDNSVMIWNEMENDVKAKIDDELTNFRDRLHLILNQRQINCEYLFGIAQEDHGCENMPQEFFGNHYHDENHNIQNQDVHQGLESGLGSLGSENSIAVCDIDNASERSMLSTQYAGSTQEQRKNEYVIRILLSTMKINNAVTQNLRQPTK